MSHPPLSSMVFKRKRLLLKMLFPLLLISVAFKTIRADVVWLKDGRIGAGRLVSENEQRIEFQVDAFLQETETVPETQTPTQVSGMQIGQVMVVEKRNVLQIHINFDRRRLENLDPRKPQDYLEYAEELAMEKMDPTALRLAKRLYLLAAATGKTEVQQSSLLGLAALELDSNRKNQILLYLKLKTGYQGAKPSSNAGDSAEPGKAIAKDWKAESQYMLTLIRAIRREQSQEAINLLRLANDVAEQDAEEREESEGKSSTGAKNNVEIARSAIARWSSEWSLDQWNALARSKSRTDLQLRKLLSLEIKLMKAIEIPFESSNLGPTFESGNRINEVSKNWAEQALESSARSVVLPMLESLLDPSIEKLNLNANRYRDGVWVE